MKRLNRLLPQGKWKIVGQQLLPILTYGCELYPTPSEQQRRLANDMYRWTVGAYKGSRGDKVQDLAVVVANKRVRWAASVYGRHQPELREIAEPILREALSKDTVMRWMQGGNRERGEVPELGELRKKE